MADYYPLIDKAVMGLEKSTAEARRTLYDRARAALLEQLQGVAPPLSDQDINRERSLLEEAIRKVEREAAHRSRLDPLPPTRPEPRPQPQAEAASPAPPGAEPPELPRQAGPGERSAQRSRPEAAPRNAGAGRAEAAARAEPPPRSPRLAASPRPLNPPDARPVPGRQATALSAAAVKSAPSGAPNMSTIEADEGTDAGDAPPDRTERSRWSPGGGPSLSDKGLKGFRNVVAETETLGAVTAQAAKNIRAAFQASAPPAEAHDTPAGARTAARADPKPRARPDAWPAGRGESRGERTDPRGDRAEPRVERTEPRNERAERRGERTEPRNERAEPRNERAEPRGERTEPRNERAEPRDERTEPRNERAAEPRGERTEPRGERAEPRNERVEPRAERTEPRNEKAEPRNERAEPRAERTESRNERAAPRGERPESRTERAEPRNERAAVRSERAEPRTERVEPRAQRSERAEPRQEPRAAVARPAARAQPRIEPEPARPIPRRPSPRDAERLLGREPDAARGRDLGVARRAREPERPAARRFEPPPPPPPPPPPEELDELAEEEADDRGSEASFRTEYATRAPASIVRQEDVRSRAPQVSRAAKPERKPAAKRLAVPWKKLFAPAITAVFVLAVGAIALWKGPTIIASIRSTPSFNRTPDQAPSDAGGRTKDASRIGQPPLASQGEGALVAQKVVLYEEDQSDPTGKRFVGSAVWHDERLPPAPGQSPDLTIRADIEIPEQRIGIRWSLRRNDDKALPASHTIEIMFTLPADFSHGGISNIPGVLMKQGEATRGVPLAGLAVKVTTNFFLIGLSSVDADMQRNIQLLKERSWFDIPVVYGDGKRAIIAIEKGTPGERAFSDAFASWGQ